MSRLLGPLDQAGRVPSRQQTRIASFLVSAHGALARRLALALPAQMKAGWQTELNAQYHREVETVSLLMRATSWAPDPELILLAPSWEAAWLPKPSAAVADGITAFTIDTAALGHAMHAAIRPAALLPDTASAEDPFVLALRRIEFDSGRLMQAQIMFLKGPDLLPFREAVNSAVERRHQQVRELWETMLRSIGVERKTKD